MSKWSCKPVNKTFLADGGRAWQTSATQPSGDPFPRCEFLDCHVPTVQVCPRFSHTRCRSSQFWTCASRVPSSNANSSSLRSKMSAKKKVRDQLVSNRGPSTKTFGPVEGDWNNPREEDQRLASPRQHWRPSPLLPVSPPDVVLSKSFLLIFLRTTTSVTFFLQCQQLLQFLRDDVNFRGQRAVASSSLTNQRSGSSNHQEDFQNCPHNQQNHRRAPIDEEPEEHQNCLFHEAFRVSNAHKRRTRASDPS